MEQNDRTEIFGSNPVKNAYWAFFNEEGKQVDANGFVIPNGHELDKMVRDIIISRSVPPSYPESLGD